MGGEKQGQGLCPWTPPGSETLDLIIFACGERGLPDLGYRLSRPLSPQANKRMGVWGPRPQRVQGRALASLS